MVIHRYKGFAIMFNPVISRYYFYSGSYTKSKLNTFKSIELAERAIDSGKLEPTKS